MRSALVSGWSRKKRASHAISPRQLKAGKLRARSEKLNASKRIYRQAQGGARSGLQFGSGDEVRQLHDVAGQEEHGGRHLLRGVDPPRAEGRRRAFEAVSESRGESQTASGREEL